MSTVPVLSVEDVMTRDIATISADSSVAEAWQVMFGSGRTHLIVVDRGRCVGVVDDRVIALEWPSGAFESRRRQLAALCSGGCAAVAPAMTVREVALLMMNSGQTALAVATDVGRPVGLVSALDLVAVLAHP